MRLPEAFSFYCSMKINSGNRALAHLPIELAAVNARAPFIIANRDQVGKKRFKFVIDAFRTSGLTLGVYDRLPDQPVPFATHALIPDEQSGKRLLAVLSNGNQPGLHAERGNGERFGTSGLVAEFSFSLARLCSACSRHDNLLNCAI